MPVLAKFTKQPADVIDYDFDYRDWLADREDTASSVVVTADPGITITNTVLSGGVVKVFLSGGTDGVAYKITCTLTTTGTRVKQAEITVAVKEV